MFNHTDHLSDYTSMRGPEKTAFNGSTVVVADFNRTLPNYTALSVIESTTKSLPHIYPCRTNK